MPINLCGFRTINQSADEREKAQALCSSGSLRMTMKTQRLNRKLTNRPNKLLARLSNFHVKWLYVRGMVLAYFVNDRMKLWITCGMMSSNG